MPCSMVLDSVRCSILLDTGRCSMVLDDALFYSIGYWALFYSIGYSLFYGIDSVRSAVLFDSNTKLGRAGVFIFAGYLFA